MTLMTLCVKRSVSINNLNVQILRTLPGIYGPLGTSIRKISTLIRSASITALDGKPLSDKEQRILHWRVHGESPVDIFHHPLVKEENESDIRPSADYIDPSTFSRNLFRYQTAVSFPYLTSSKGSDFGVACTDCVLHMQWEEMCWTNEQEARRNHGFDPSATLRVRDFINGVRRKGCAIYSVSEEALTDGELIVENCKRKRQELLVEDNEQVEKRFQWMSIQEHMLIHKQEKLSQEEATYRKQMKKKAAPLAPP
jgi:hypothetical protein